MNIAMFLVIAAKVGSLDFPELMTATTAWLSQYIIILFLCHLWAHNLSAPNMFNISRWTI